MSVYVLDPNEMAQTLSEKTVTALLYTCQAGTLSSISVSLLCRRKLDDVACLADKCGPYCNAVLPS